MFSNQLFTLLRIYVAVLLSRPICLQTHPEIWLTGYRQLSFNNPFKAPVKVAAPKEFRMLPTFKNKFILKNVTDYVVTNTTEIVLVCQSSSPVEWTVPNKSQLPLFMSRINSESERTSEFSDPAQHQPQNQLFKTFLAVPCGTEFFSVTFSCRHTESRGNQFPQQTFIHLNVAGDGPPLENMWRLQNVSSDDSPLILPCRATASNATILLQRKVKWEWKPVSKNDYSYNPKMGIMLSQNQSLLGQYRCYINGTDPEKMCKLSKRIDVILKTETTRNLEPHYNHNGTAFTAFNDDGVLKCCTGVISERPKVRFHRCHNGRFHCNLLKYFESFNLRYFETDEFNDPHRTDCVRVEGARFMPGLLDCQGSNIDYRGQFIEIFRSIAGNILRRKAESINLHENRTVVSLTEFTEVDNESVSVEQKMIILVGHPKLGDKTRFSADLLENSFHSGSNFSRVLIRGRRKCIAEYGRSYYYSGEPITIMCFGMKYFYGFGAYLRLNWRNGTKQVLRADENQTNYRLTFYGVRTQARNIQRIAIAHFAEELKASIEMESVDCFMPTYNTAEWDKLSYPLKIVPSVPPKFSGKLIEEIRLSDGKNRTLNCDVVEGLPVARMKVTKDGNLIHEYIPEHYGNKREIRVTLDLDKILKGKKGKLQCIAENVAGKSTKTFKVVTSC